MKSALIRFWKHQVQRRQQGQSIIILAIGFIMLVTFVGITTDISLMFVRYSALRRAVDSASIAAANQLRQDRSIANVSLSARQFIQFHGLNPEDVHVDTCATTDYADEELCTDDQRKLVRVTAEVISPTVFLSLIGWQDFPIQASAISETAALDVIVILDVSESMLRYTSLQDWAEEGYGAVFRPPRVSEIASNIESTYVNRDCGEPLQAGEPAEPQAAPCDGNAPSARWQDFEHYYWETRLLNQTQIDVNQRLYYTTSNAESTDVYTGAAPTYQSETHSSGDADATATLRAELEQYQVITDNGTWFQESNAAFSGAGWSGSPPYATADIAGTQNLPNQRCAVRFSPTTLPISAFPGYTDTSGDLVGLAQLWDEIYDQNNVTYDDWQWPGSDDGSGNFLPSVGINGFVPTYNWYGCCNDPNQDGTFEDLVCQPFRDARDATDLFLDQIDFFRGDRVGMVTFDRSAFLVNPYGYICEAGWILVEGRGTPYCYNGAAYGHSPASPPAEEDRPAFIDGSDDFALAASGGNPMIESLAQAKVTLNQLVGVRTEPNFYVYRRGQIFDDGSDTFTVTGNWGGRFAAGRNPDGSSLPINYEDPTYNPVTTEDDETGEQTPVAYTFPVAANCPYQTGGLPVAFTLFDWWENRGPGPPDSGGHVNALAHVGMPNINMDTTPDGNYNADLWEDYETSYELGGTTYDLTHYRLAPYGWPNGGDPILRTYDSPPIAGDGNMIYELRGACRGTNIGSALREANNALLNPETTRPFGTVWVMVLLSDGAAAASDPVRRNGWKITPANPYFIADPTNPTQALRADPIDTPGVDTTETVWGRAGFYQTKDINTTSGAVTSTTTVQNGYGAFGLCPIGTPSIPGELMTDPFFPWCSDEEPETRHVCDFRPARGEETDNLFDKDYIVGQWDPNDLSRGWRTIADERRVVAEYPALQELNDCANDPGCDIGPFLAEWNEVQGNLYDVDISPPDISCSLYYDVDDYARDWADEIGLETSIDTGAGDALLPTIFTIGFGLEYLNGTGPSYCENNIGDCLGEQMLRYIADVGDNNRIDNDYYQLWLAEPRGELDPEAEANGLVDYGPRDDCQTQNVGPDDGSVAGSYDDNSDDSISSGEAATMYDPLPPQQSCGNYFWAPDGNTLQAVFDQIASRMFTRLAR